MRFLGSSTLIFLLLAAVRLLSVMGMKVKRHLISFQTCIYYFTNTVGNQVLVGPTRTFGLILSFLFR